MAAEIVVGDLLRDWRLRRRFSQQALAADTGVSTRHLSYVETGKSRPSRELILHLADHMNIPLRAQNELLLSAGLAPEYPARDLSDPALQPIQAAVARVLEAHDPYPAFAIDAHWNLITANTSAGFFLDGVAPHLLEPPINVIRVSLHPEGIATRVLNFDDYANHLLGRLRHQVDQTGDPTLAALEADIQPLAPKAAPSHPPFDVILPMVFRSDFGDLELFSMIATFGTPLDVTVSEIALESFYPSSPQTRTALQEHAASGR